jgi:adenine-specific DNA-methyltransferase
MASTSKATEFSLLRERSGLGLADAASEFNVALALVRAWENGQSGVPDRVLRTLSMIADFAPEAASKLPPVSAATIETPLPQKAQARKRLDTARRYDDVEEAKAGGVTYTPSELSEFVADQIVQIADFQISKPLRILDPAVGHGELLHSLLRRLKGPVEVFGFDTDPVALAVASERLSRDYPWATIRLEEGSFLDHVLDNFAEGLFESVDRYDLIIANPPYVRTQIMGAERAQALARQFNLSGRVDLYHAFLLGMARVLRPTGTAGIIVSNRFMTTRGGAATRCALLSTLCLKRVFDLGDTKLFEAAVLPAVLIARGGHTRSDEPPEFCTIYETSENSDRRVPSPIDALGQDGIAETLDGRRFRVSCGQLDNGGEEAGIWRLGSQTVNAWLSKVEQKTWGTFRTIGKIRVGVKTTADSVFLPKVWREELELLRPVTTHHFARRYQALPLTRKILYPHELVDGRKRAIPLDPYPRTRAYLEAHRTTLEARTYVIESGREWYEIWVAQNPAEWDAPKVVFRDISEKPVFWMDRTGSIVNGDCYWLTGEENLLWLALAVANSTFIERFYDCRFNNKLYAGRRRFITQYVEQFPLPDPMEKVSQDIISRTKRLYDLVTDRSEAEAAEQELDLLVWHAFGVSPEEI